MLGHPAEEDEFLVPGPIVRGRRVDGFGGRWAVQDGLVVTAVCLTDG
ncbi:hypothetical protein [Curtobacterium sp. 24E2]|nr:hypothetical protein JN350_00175 [Curtobacterium sp. 24E2]